MGTEVVCPREDAWDVVVPSQRNDSDDGRGDVLVLLCKDGIASRESAGEFFREEGDAFAAKFDHIVFGAYAEDARDEGDECGEVTAS